MMEGVCDSQIMFKTICHIHQWHVSTMPWEGPLHWIPFPQFPHSSRSPPVHHHMVHCFAVFDHAWLFSFLKIGTTSSVYQPKDTALYICTTLKSHVNYMSPILYVAGPENIPGHMFRECGSQLADVLIDIFNISRRQGVFKATTITLVSQKSTISCLNDYLSLIAIPQIPVTLTPVIMKY